MFKRFIGSFLASFILLLGLSSGITNAQSTTANKNYVALGDSVAAGLGLPPDSTNTGVSASCGRSAQAYPTIVAAKLNMNLTNQACSGATVGDLVTNQYRAGATIPPQLEAAFAHGTPQLITITAGANDAHWANFLQKCYTESCGTASDSLKVQIYMASLKLKLHYALLNISLRSGFMPPRVVVTGYYGALSAQCAADPHFTAQELAWIHQGTQLLNNTLRQTVSAYSFTTFAPVDFTGHDLCSGTSWVQGLTDPAPFHPTANGQAAISRSVLAAL